MAPRFFMFYFLFFFFPLSIVGIFVIYDLQYDTELRSYINKTFLVYFTLVLCSFVSHFHLYRENKGAIYSSE